MYNNNNNNNELGRQTKYIQENNNQFNLEMDSH